jgi:hypothetical protein
MVFEKIAPSLPASAQVETRIIYYGLFDCMNFYAWTQSAGTWSFVSQTKNFRMNVFEKAA